MEKFFIVTDKSRLKKDYEDYLENSKKVNELAKEFMDAHGFETHHYGVRGDIFFIVPTREDKVNFSNQLYKDSQGNGLVGFKKNSKMGKAWIDLLEDKKITVQDKPSLPLYFSTFFGRSSSRLFKVKDIVYCSIDANTQKIDNPEGFEEIKASEFYKIIEENS